MDRMNIEAWDKYFAGIPILGWELRSSRPDLWFRIHYLPSSKRYPENDEEKSIVLERYYSISSDVIGDNAASIAYWYCYENFHGLKGSKISQFQDEMFEADIFSTSVNFSRSNFLSDIFLAIANDEISQIMFLNPETGNVFAPYDGGADLFIWQQDLKSDLISKYQNWLSERADVL